MDSITSAKYRSMPSCWEILSNDGTTVTAYNSKLQESFSGTASAFKDKLTKAATASQSGAYFKVDDSGNIVDVVSASGNPAMLLTAQLDANGNPTGGIMANANLLASASLKLFASSGIPFVMPSNGTVNNTSGSVTVGTAFDYVIGSSFTYFPTGALYTSSPSGWYYTNWTAATICTVYSNIYTNGVPSIPSNPTPLTTVAGSYTQSVGFDVAGPSIVIPGNSMGNNGTIEWARVANNNNSAGTKYYNTYLANAVMQGLSQTTNPKETGRGSIKNRGRATAQVSANAAHGDSGNASTIVKSSLDTTQNQIVSMSLQLAVATDYAVIESFSFAVYYAS
jgi:hypothetical protein